MYQPLNLPEEELLICVFFRDRGGDSLDRMEAVDFQRRLDKDPPEGGLSFYRYETTDYRFIANQVKRKPRLNRGFALVSIKQLNELKIKVCGDLALNSQHVCIHCLACNCEEDNCQPASSAACQLIAPENQLASSDYLRKALSEAMSVSIPATLSRDTLLSNIFTTDVLGTPPERNREYARRWEVEAKPTALSAEDISR